jgi:hypothetical protein
MSKVRLYGNTSGYVDLQAPDVAGDVTITLPNESGPFATETYVDSAVASAGGLVAVKHALFTGTQATSLAAGASAAVTSLSITHSTAAATNKVVLFYTLGTISNSENSERVGVRLLADSTDVIQGDAEGSRPRIFTGGGPSGDSRSSDTGIAVHSPGTTDPVTYTVHILNAQTLTLTLYVNRTNGNNNDVRGSRGASTLTLMEVKV